MPIDGRMCDRMAPGMELIARYKGETYRVGVVEGEDGALRYRLPDGREFKTPSAAGSAVMGGIACNGWRFWSLAADEPEQSDPPKKRAKPARRRGQKNESGSAQGAGRSQNAAGAEPALPGGETT